MKTETLHLEARDPAETFTRVAAQLSHAMLANVQATDPELAARVAQVIAEGDRLCVMCTFDKAPLIELLSKDAAGATKRIGSIQMKARAYN